MPTASAAATSSSRTRSSGWWLMPPGLRSEQHRGRHPRRDDHRVVAGAARHVMHGVPGGRHRRAPAPSVSGAAIGTAA